MLPKPLTVKYESPAARAASASAREIAAARPSGVCARSLSDRSLPWLESKEKRAVRTTRPKIVPGDLIFFGGGERDKERT